jgi:transcription elongation factor GreA
VLIKKGGADKVSIGHTVTVAIGPAERTYQILGSAETNPDKGIISYTSPIGAALIGRSVGDTVEVVLADRKISYKILKIS